MTQNKLIIFSKAPVPGQVKTRLIPQLGIHKATQLHIYMLEQTLIMASTLKNVDCELHCAPHTDHDILKSLALKYGIKLLPQHGDDLGDKMAHAMKTSLNFNKQCLIIGTDCPEMNAAYIYQAFEQLDNVDVVLGPAMDGGYVLIGCNIFDYKIFNNINWSTSAVLQQTIKNINDLHLKYHKLNALSDVDNYEDLSLLSTQYLHNAFHEMII